MEAAAERFRGFKGLKGWQTAGSNALTREGYVQAKEGFRHFRGSEGLVEAAAERFRGFKGLKAGKRQARMP